MTKLKRHLPVETGLTRRRLVLTGLTLPFSVAAAPSLTPSGNRLVFHVLRDGSMTGQHSVRFERGGDSLTISIATDIVAGSGPVGLFRYKHRATEIWKNGQVATVDAETNDNGTPEHMTAMRDEGGLVVEGSKTSRYVTPPRSLPGTYWNRAMLDTPFINIQDGRLMHPTVTQTGTERLEVAGGMIEARRYSLHGDINLDTYYDLTATWAGLRYIATDGSEIRYLRA